MAKKRPNYKRIVNRRASYDYALSDSFIVGLELTGAETKALRLGHGQLQGAYVTIKDGELWLINAVINSHNGILIDASQQSRSRRLLAKKKEIERLDAAKSQGRTIVPLEILTGGRYIKLRIAMGRGKKNWDKRSKIKERDENRQIHSVIKREQIYR